MQFVQSVWWPSSLEELPEAFRLLASEWIASSK
jgi:hypothetical protein